MTHDVLILGAGPAGMAAAAACVGEGLQVALLAPSPQAPWVPTYCSFRDELPSWVPTAGEWSSVSVHVGTDPLPRVNRTYARLDREALQATLWEQARGLHTIDGVAVDVHTHRRGTTVWGQAGQEYRAAVVVDAAMAPPASAYQTAFGLVAEIDGPGAALLDAACPRWMDLSMSFADGHEVPSFLYALPWPDGTWLLEETVLIRHSRVPHDVLERRLHTRLERLGVGVRHVVHVERCSIPMDLPEQRGPTLGFGTVGGMVHPATGFLVSRVLNSAPALASAICRGLQQSPRHAVKRGREALWPGDARRRHRLYRFAARALARLSAAHTRTFFRAFFHMPPAFVRGFVSGSLPTADLLQGLTTLFTELPPSIRWRLLHGSSATELARAAMSPRQPTLTAEFSP